MNWEERLGKTLETVLIEHPNPTAESVLLEWYKHCAERKPDPPGETLGTFAACILAVFTLAVFSFYAWRLVPDAVPDLAALCRQVDVR